MKKNLLLSALVVLSSICCPMVSGQRASWMSGKWGIGYRIPAGGTVDGVVNYYIPNYNVSGVIKQILDIGGVSWVNINLSGGAFGDVYMAWHSVLTDLNPTSTPKRPRDGGRDLFLEIATALQANGIKVIACKLFVTQNLVFFGKFCCTVTSPCGACETIPEEYNWSEINNVQPPTAHLF